MHRRRASLAVALVCAGALAMSGCSGAPAPAKTTPLFASEDEAFAAAEKTYRAYVDALNQVDLSDPKTFEPVFAWTIGDANSEERKTFSAMHADGWIVSGMTRTTKFIPSLVTLRPVAVTAQVCSDVSDVAVVNGDGVSQVAPDRPDKYVLEVGFEAAHTPTGLAISSSHAVVSELCSR